MEKILEKLWNGEIYPNEIRFKKTKEVDQIIKRIADHHDNLWATLSDSQKDLLERFDDCYTELEAINERDTFIYGFKLGARIAFEVMSFCGDEEIISKR